MIEGGMEESAFNTSTHTRSLDESKREENVFYM